MKQVFVHELNPLFDMIISLKRIANNDSFEKNYFEAAAYTSSDRILEILSEIEGKLSRYFKQELKLFFNDQLSFYSVLWRLILRKELKSFQEIMNALAADDPADIRRCMLEDCIIKECFSGNGENKDMVDEVFNNKEKFYEVMNQNTTLSQEDKEKIFEIYEYPEDNKERFIRLLERYHEIYQAYDQELFTVTSAIMEKSRKLCAKNPDKFLTEFLKLKGSFVCKTARTRLIPSYFAEILIYIPLANDEHCILVYGTDIEKKRSLEKKTEERRQFFKIFSEEKRAELIKKLSKHTYYGNEIAQELNLTSATASYHLSMLQGIGIVELQKEGNRIYYSLNKEVLKNLFDKAYEDLTD
ncbi:MAG: metalloregulator ArsR/SmtB family transcription factor [Clostridia bacterium]